MKNASKLVLLGMSAVLALCSSLTATASPGETMPEAELQAPGNRRCTAIITAPRVEVNLAPGQETEVRRWTQNCRGPTSITVTEGRGLSLSFQRLEKGHWKMIPSQSSVSGTIEIGVTYRILVKNTSAKPASGEVVHVVGIRRR